MTQIFTVARGRTLGIGMNAKGPGSQIPIGDTTVVVDQAGNVSEISLTEALQHQAGGFGRISNTTPVPSSPAPTATGLVRGFEREPVALPPAKSRGN